jgi:hypothetical protein
MYFVLISSILFWPSSSLSTNVRGILIDPQHSSPPEDKRPDPPTNMRRIYMDPLHSSPPKCKRADNPTNIRGIYRY